MRRFVTLTFLLLFTIPFGISISGCGKKTAITFCNGGDSGPIVGQLTTITLQPKIFGISLNVGQFGQVQAPTATDCKGSAVSAGAFTYGSSDLTMTIVDVVPTTGRLCAGTWNRNTGGGIPNYTVCNVTGKTGTAFLTASANGATSNPIPVFVHPIVTSVVLGSPSTDCLADPASNCSPAATTTTANSVACTVNPSTGCCTTPPISRAGSFTPNSCLSQGTSGQLAARVFAGAGGSQQNISCQVGHLGYAAQTSSVVTIDENGIATAQQPGSSIITSSLSNAGSTAGFFSTCPPASIALTAWNSALDPNGVPTVTVNQNNTLPITAVVTDTKGAQLTGLALTYVSTTPTTLPSGGNGTVTPIFPGSGSITAICQPPTCNSSPLNEIGLFGNGKPVTSNNIVVNTPGSNSSIIYTASTNSLYLVSVDFTINTIGAPVRLPYVPNSMVISNDGTSIYLGSSTELMTVSALNNAVSREDLSLPGTVLAVSPDNATLVVTDPVRQTVSLANSTGGLQTSYGGVGTHAQFSPDSSTVYITAGSQILVHSTFTGWSALNTSPAATDVAVAVPSVGAFFAGTTTTARSYCPVTTVSSVSGQPATSNVYYPDAGVAAPRSDRVAATNDGGHILGATVAGPTLIDLRLSHLSNGTKQSGLPTGQCPLDGSALTFTATPTPLAIPGIAPTAITGVDPTSDSAFAFITYSGTGGVLPLYQPAGSGSLTSVKLSGSATAPVDGVFSSDNSTFFVGTSGDNLIHLVTRTSTGYTDSSTIAPKLPDAAGNIVTPDLIVQRPRKTT